MLANLQRTTTLILLAAIAGWAAWTIVIGRPEFAWIGAAVVAATYAGILGVEFWLLRRSFAPSDPLRPTISQLIRCWIHECAAAPRVFFWRQPFRSRSIVDCPSAPGPRRRGVVLVHGFACNRGLWNPWMRRLEADGIPFVAVNLEPVFGSIDSYIETIERAVRALEQATGEAPVIVAHSMGGLAVRAWLARGQPHRVLRVVTVASPHQGTRIAQHGFSTNTREMRVGSPWLESLTARENADLYRRFTCFWSHCDNIVFPSANATLPGADNRHLPATPHVQMAYHPAVYEEVLRLLKDVAPVFSRSSSGIPRSGPGAASPPATG